MQDLKKYRNILVLAAHPDDETIGCGATIAKMSSLGSDIRLLTFTDGISARKKGTRVNQLEGVSIKLGISDYRSFNFPDNEMDTVSLLSVVKKIETYLEENGFNPDLVLTHSPSCLNVDHRVVYNATMTAFRGLSKFNPIKIACYEITSSSEWNPLSSFVGNLYIDVKDHMNKKIDALSLYQDEMREHPHPRSIENIIRIAKIRGSECGLDLAERFMIVREVLV